MKSYNRSMWLALVVLVLGTGAWVACSSDAARPTGQAADAAQISHYTCPMHPQIHEEHPGECPICHMQLTPVYREGAQSTPSAGSGDDARAVTISPQRQQLIGMRTARAVIKRVRREIRTVGRVAFDPDLAIAQREFLAMGWHLPSVKAAARSRLRLLGMSDAEIAALERHRRVDTALFLPTPGAAVWVYATLFPEEMALVTAGMAAQVSLPSGAEQAFAGTVRAVDPTVDPMTRAVRARIVVPRAGGALRPDTYVNVVLQVDAGEALTIPKSAVMFTGTRRIAFVRGGRDQFHARELVTGIEAGDDLVVVSGLTAGDQVVSQAAFFVDAESRLKAAVTSGGPACPTGETWDAGMAMCMPQPPAGAQGRPERGKAHD